MTYVGGSGGGLGDHLSSGGGDACWTFAAVEERLVDALYCWGRMDDGDRRFGLSGRISSIWRQSVDDPLALIERHQAAPEPELRPLPLSRGDIARMSEASDWLVHVPDRDRRLVIAALRCLARGEAQVPWRKLKHALGIPFGADGLRKRYSRAITAIAEALNVAEIPKDGLSR